jgi:hypothetical protein
MKSLRVITKTDRCEICEGRVLTIIKDNGHNVCVSCYTYNNK